MKTTQRDMRKVKRSHKILAIFLNVIMLSALLPYNMLYANNNGPNSPEAAGFEPVDATDMVSLSTGDLSYVLPLLDVEGYPVNLSYHAGITSDLDASWVGLGWYLTPGAINRSVTNTPDDLKNGVSIDFNSYYHQDTYHGVSVAVGFPGAISVGVGANWGGGKGLSGSVNASAGLATLGLEGVGGSISADTRGDVSVGLSYGIGLGDNAGIGGGVSYSLTSQEVSFGLGVGAKGQDSGSNDFSDVSNSLNISFDGSGSFGVGAGSNYSNSADASARSGGSVQSRELSVGDASVSQQSFAIALPLHVVGLPITLGYNQSKVKVNIQKGYKHHDWGALYSYDFSALTSGKVTGTGPKIYDVNSGTGFNDYVNRATSLDTYSTPVPQTEEEFVGDYSKQIEKLNFNYLGYDNYNVSAQGLMGNMTPHTFENATIAGKGLRTTNADNEDIHVYWHAGSQIFDEFTDSWGTRHSPSNTLPNKTLGYYNYDQGSRPSVFYFDGQFTQSEQNTIDGLINATSGNDLSDFIDKGLHSGFSTINNQRAKSPNYVEVFTNEQIYSGAAGNRGLISPATVSNNDRDNSALFDPTGIGGYKITAPDGKTYHYALPVYHYEQVHRNLINEQEDGSFNAGNVNERREFSRYATHWLLTAITGPDYVDRPDPINNELGTFNKEDYGYWVELEYGKWSDGFVWRDPYPDRSYNYNTNEIDKIEDKDKGGYSFGRKQLYYLDKINTRNQTALFVKDIRYDAIGKDLKFKFSNSNGGYDGDPKKLGNTGNGTNDNSLNFTDPNLIVQENGVSYAREYSLRLKRIVLVNGDAGKNLSKNSSGNLGVQYQNSTSTPYQRDSSHFPNWESPYFEDVYDSSNYSYGKQMEGNVLDINDVSTSFIKENALKVIDLEQDYSLAKGSASSAAAPNHSNPELGNNDKGKLSLNAVHYKDRNLRDFMPPIRFDYFFKEMSNIAPPQSFGTTTPTPDQIKFYVEQKRDFRDNWGYMQGDYNGTDGSGNKTKAWSLKSVSMPTGARIDIDYEEDDYWIEAFSRRYWQTLQNELEFRFDVQDISGNNTKHLVQVNIRKKAGLNDNIDFSQYFDTSRNAFLNLSGCLNRKASRNVKIDIDKEVEVISVGTTGVILQFEANVGQEFIDSSDNIGWWQVPGWFRLDWSENDEVKNKGVYKNFDCPISESNYSWTMNLNYKLIANKVPEDETGGGLRVKQLRTTDGATTYKTTYDYTNPFTGKSSGITSYAPVDGVKFVPYQSELPGPGVMYEYVTMRTSGANENDYTSETRYRHHVLKPVFDIFNPEIEMEVLDVNADTEDRIFWAEVNDNFQGFNGTASHKIHAKKIDIHVNTALLGQIKSIENFNSFGQLMMRTENEYVNGEILTGGKLVNGNNLAEFNKGITKETFNSMKTVFETNSEGTSITNTKRLLSISSKTLYNNMLRKIKVYSGGVETSQEFSDVDPWLGSFRKTITKLADGTQLTTEKVPAYEKYAAMGSKVLSSGNANMLSQEAFSITTANINGTDKTLNASLTTWKNNWNYSNLDYTAFDSNAGPGVWRKQAQYIWKDAIDSEHGNYVSTLSASQDNFNWSANAPSSSKWQKVSETTRYNHWSSPLEVRDINGNFASTIMVDNDSKVGAVVNSRASASYADGSEYINNSSASYLLKNQITPLRDNKAHTGLYSYKTQSNGETVYSLSTSSGTSQTDLSKALQPGTYKISFWHKPSIGLTSNPSLLPQVIFNGNTIQPSEQVDAACWRLLNYYIEVGVNQNVSVQIKQNGSGAINFDDFRLHPAESSMTTYVYDHLGYLTHINGSNNLSTAYVYDDAGNLKAIYNEIQNMHQDGSKVMVDPKDDDSIIGGFILKSSYRRNFKGHTYQYDEPVKVLDNCSSTQIPSNYQPGYYL
ncbi:MULTISPECIES: hypothetical protein [Leeuwenhoekiella]|uniref:hypothetical protein n=1 Tax=Leeuwenhoekiella TaxID=283735 RepID=UPI00300B1BAE|tara:strand:+ start:30784 stop:36453 length:5670 start_codon:yes stop_codon:yes gene_type:complete